MLQNNGKIRKKINFSSSSTTTPHRGAIDPRPLALTPRNRDVRVFRYLQNVKSVVYLSNQLKSTQTIKANLLKDTPSLVSRLMQPEFERTRVLRDPKFRNLQIQSASESGHAVSPESQNVRNGKNKARTTLTEKVKISGNRATRLQTRNPQCNGNARIYPRNKLKVWSKIIFTEKVEISSNSGKPRVPPVETRENPYLPSK